MATRQNPRVLLAFFSRAGENYAFGGRVDLVVGNTQVVADAITRLLECDVYRIEAADPYPADYDATVARNVREQDAEARPAIANPLPDLAGYDVVVLGSPIWNVRPPMIMRTFTESLDFAGLTIHPFTTHGMSGLGTAVEEYRQACRGARIGAPLAIRGEQAADADAAISDWLNSIGLICDDLTMTHE